MARLDAEAPPLQSQPYDSVDAYERERSFPRFLATVVDALLTNRSATFVENMLQLYERLLRYVLKNSGDGEVMQTFYWDHGNEERHFTDHEKLNLLADDGVLLRSVVRSHLADSVLQRNAERFVAFCYTTAPFDAYTELQRDATMLSMVSNRNRIIHESKTTCPPLYAWRMQLGAATLYTRYEDANRYSETHGEDVMAPFNAHDNALLFVFVLYTLYRSNATRSREVMDWIFFSA